MSRNLYTFAVVKPSLARGWAGPTAADHSPERIAQIERDLLDCAADIHPLVSFYRVILDGWSTTHRDLQWSDTTPAWVIEALRTLEEAGIALVEPDSGAAVPLGLLLGEEALNSYAQRAFVAALEDAAAFSLATDCPLVILWRCVGLSRDDAAYRVSP